MPTKKEPTLFDDPMLSARLDNKEDFLKHVKKIVITEEISKEEFAYTAQCLAYFYTGSYAPGWFNFEMANQLRSKITPTNMLTKAGYEKMSYAVESNKLLAPGTYYVAVWPYADWKMGVFYDDGNCFMGSRSSHVSQMFHSGASAYLVFSDKEAKTRKYHLFDRAPIGRGWVLPAKFTETGKKAREGVCLTNIYSESGRNVMMMWQLFFHINGENGFVRNVNPKSPFEMNSEMTRLMYWNQAFFAITHSGESITEPSSNIKLEWDYSKKRAVYHDQWECGECKQKVPFQQTTYDEKNEHRLCNRCGKPCSQCKRIIKSVGPPPKDYPKPLANHAYENTMCWECMSKRYAICTVCQQLFGKPWKSNEDQKPWPHGQDDMRFNVCQSCTRTCTACNCKKPLPELTLLTTATLPDNVMKDSSLYQYAKLGEERYKYFRENFVPKDLSDKEVMAFKGDAGGKFRAGLGQDPRPSPTKDFRTDYWIGYRGAPSLPAICNNCVGNQIKPAQVSARALNEALDRMRNNINVAKKEKKGKPVKRGVPLRAKQRNVYAPRPVVEGEEGNAEERIQFIYREGNQAARDLEF